MWPLEVGQIVSTLFLTSLLPFELWVAILVWETSTQKTNHFKSLGCPTNKADPSV